MPIIIFFLADLPDSKLPVDITMVNVEERIISRVLQCRKSIRRLSSNPRVDSVVDHLKLYLKVTVVALFKGQQNLEKQMLIVIVPFCVW